MTTKKVLLFFVIWLISYLLLAETVLRIKSLGVSGTVKSFSNQNKHISVLGTNNWVIPDTDLGYKLNPELPWINEFFMGDEEIKIPKPPGTTRIIILGDSIPFSGDPTFVALLKDKFKSSDKVEIFNAGIPGYTTYQELIFLKKYLIKTDPDFVILTYCLNDNYRFLHLFDEKTQMILTEEAQESLKINSKLDELVLKSYFLSALKLTFAKETVKQVKSQFPWDNFPDFNTAWKDHTWGDFSDHLREMNNILKKQNSKLLVVIFPIEEQLDESLLKINSDYVTKPQQKVAYYSDKFDIPYLDLFNNFLYNKQSGASLFTDGLHLSAEGASLTANAIYEFFLANKDFQTN